MKVLVAGAGIFGVTAALELRARGHEVRLCDPGPVPHPLAASTDLSKVVRLEYGADEDYVALGERALDGWRRWNRELAPLFHECGVLFMRRGPIDSGTFEGDSFELLKKRGHPIERMNGAELSKRFPAWRFAASKYIDGIFHPQGGWAESGRVVERLAAEARARGVTVDEGRAPARLDERGGRVTGVVTTDGARLEADCVVAATGAWTPRWLPSTAAWLRTTGMPVFHLRPDSPELFRAENFPVFGADISNTGYYGFPLHSSGVVKIANHGPGREMAPDSPARTVTDEETAHLRAFLNETFPDLSNAPIVNTRVCLYTDTRDGHFWIARDPEREGLVLATGGSGHAFKFAPALGALTADAVEGRAHPWSAKFRWRPDLQPARSEAARRQ